MRALTIGVAAVGMVMVVGNSTSRPASTARGADLVLATASSTPAVPAVLAGNKDTEPPDMSDGALTQVVQQTCVVCHNDQLLTGNLSLQQFDVANVVESGGTAEKMITKLRAEMMPPPGIPRPGGDTLLALVERLEQKADEAVVANPRPGSRRFQRLNRDEYARAVRTLLALEVDAATWLPTDNYVGSFDTYSDAQGLSTTSLEAFLRAASDISRLAVGDPTAASVDKTYSVPIEVSQHAWDHIEGAPYGTRGGIVALHDFPADGEYVFSIETLLSEMGLIFENVDVAIDGERVALLAVPHGRARRGGGGSSAGRALRTEPIFVRAGERRVSAAFVRVIEGPYEDRLMTFDWSLVGGEDSEGWANYGITALPHARGLTISGPENPTGVSETTSRTKIFTCRSTSPAEERPCAMSIIERLAGEAYRRPLTSEDVVGLMGFYDQAAEEGNFEIGVRTALQAILSHPSFIFRMEQEPEGVGPGESYVLSDLSLASRLSFFLWGTIPDEELLEVATEGRLTDQAVLEEQVMRMVADPRSEALSTRFAAQWLRLQSLDGVAPQSNLYPDYNRQIAEALRRETELLFDHLVREDRSLMELFTADYTFVNGRLARYYGIPYSGGGEEFTRVQISDPNRIGLLGHGSVLTLTSLPNRTSPVLRGKWVMEVLLGTPPPPPPPNVPAFEASPDAAGGRRLTTRERIEAHAAAPVCNSCHRFIDPIGLVLDNFDATGKWRVRENMVPLDTRGNFYDGTPISSPADLRNVILKRPIPLVRNFTENMLAYAIGRPVEYHDKPAIRAVAESAKANDYRMSSFILGVVKSDAFRMKQARAIASQ